MHRTTRIILALFLLTASTASADEKTFWRAEIDSHRLGPVEFHLALNIAGDTVRGESQSGSIVHLRDLPGDHKIDNALLEFEATLQEDGDFVGNLLAPWSSGVIELHIDGDSMRGSIKDGMLAGALSAQRVARATPIRNYPAILEAFDAVVAAKIYSPDDLQSQAYWEFHRQLEQIAISATDDLDFLLGFHWTWRNEPFSHFDLKRSNQSAEQLFAYFDEYRVGFEAATVEFENNIATLTVRTMMGTDTIEQINAAYERIAIEKPSTLIIDLRGNNGGAFAVKPLVEHVIDEPLDAGYFLSQVWNRSHESLPAADEIMASTPWTGWSITAFWKSVQESGILRIQFSPAAPNFDGPVYVLLDARSASATELAADAFRASGLATLIGQPSAGQMLSQSFFDVLDGFMVSLPVADYYSIENGRIEGNGIPVDVIAEPQQALAIATQLAGAP